MSQIPYLTNALKVRFLPAIPGTNALAFAQQAEAAAAAAAQSAIDAANAAQGPPGPIGPPGPVNVSGTPVAGQFAQWVDATTIEGTAVLPTAGDWVFLSENGVVGDGATDDTAALNAVFASLVGQARTVIWDVGRCKVTSTIVVGQLAGSGVTSFISIICPRGTEGSGINWTGSTNGEAVVFGKNKYCVVKGLSIRNDVAMGTTTGLVLGGDNSGSGNQTIGVVFENCHVIGFNTGIMASGHNGCASECTYIQQGLFSCGVGWTNADFNALNHIFIDVSTAQCGIGMTTGVVAGFQVIGASLAQNTIADFQIEQNSGTTYINGARSETSAAFVKGAVNAGGVTIERCTHGDAQAPDFNSIVGGFSQLVVRDCGFGGNIRLDIGSGIVVVENCTLERWDTTRGLPILVANAAAQFARVRFRSNTDNGAFPPRPIPDFEGNLTLWGDINPNPFMEPVLRITPQDQTLVDTYGVNTLVLSHVRHLSEGSLPGTRAGVAQTPGKNLRVSATFVASNIIAFTFVRNLTVFVGTGFGGSSPIVTAVVGTFFASDLGKPLTIPTGNDLGGTYYGYVVEFTDATHVVVKAGYATPGARDPNFAGNKAATIGENEPDAKYMVAGICGVGGVAAGGEMFWVDTIATTGFNIKSSNVASGATVTALIVR